MSIHRLFPVLLALALACDAEPDDAESVAAPAPAAPVLATPPAALAAPQPASRAPEAAAMPHARQAFDKALELIEKHYVDRGLGEDALYTGALEGALARLVQLEGHPVNELLGPDELAELLHGTTGTLVGIGVEIGLMTGAVVVIHALPGGPAAKSGLQAGDRILAIDGVSVKGQSLGDVVKRIRGEAGTEIDLFVQRDTEEWHEKLRRATIVIPNVESKLLADGLGFLRLRGVAETTPAELDAALEAMQAAGMRALVLDLRSCPGGVLDAAIAITGRFLADGQPVVTIVDRDSNRTTHTAAGDGRWRALPLAVLIGPNTSSGAEILADALQTHGRATLIGQRTLGKGTVESVHELGNGWALKLSTSRFLGASGEPLQGRGVAPQLPVAVPTDAPSVPLDALPAGDDAVAAARTWLMSHVK